MDKQCNHNEIFEEIRQAKETLTQQISAQGSDVKILQHVIFGSDETQEIGMKQKVDEIHQIVTQLKGLKWIGGALILLSASIVALKTIFKW